MARKRRIDDGRAKYMPTQEQIATEAAQIRAEWIQNGDVRAYQTPRRWPERAIEPVNCHCEEPGEET